MLAVLMLQVRLSKMCSPKHLKPGTIVTCREKGGGVVLKSFLTLNQTSRFSLFAYTWIIRMNDESHYCYII